MRRDLCLLRAPSNLGLRPPGSGRQPGTWRAPLALTEAGLIEAVRPTVTLDLERPLYDPRPEAGTRLYNGHRIRAFNLALAARVALALTQRQFALVVGGDCSILLGALAGARRGGPVSLVHVDGHSDFRHPGNYDAAAVLGAVAGMDLALATGRGEALMTGWPGVTTPLVPDEQVVQIGEREGRDPDFGWPDINQTAMTRVDVFSARQLGPRAVLDRTMAVLNLDLRRSFWVHLDSDVLDQAAMAAVDSPGSPGIKPEDLVSILQPLLSDPRCTGMTVTNYDPDLDGDGACAALLVQLLTSLVGDHPIAP